MHLLSISLIYLILCKLFKDLLHAEIETRLFHKMRWEQPGMYNKGRKGAGVAG